MVTADEIRARVEAADRARIQARADAAAQIAADVERRTTVAAELAEIDASLTARIDAGGRGDDAGRTGRVHRHPGNRTARRRPSQR